MFLIEIIHVHDDNKYYKIPTDDSIAVLLVNSVGTSRYFMVFYFPAPCQCATKILIYFFNDAVSTSPCTMQKSNIIKGVIGQIDCKTKRLLLIFRFYLYP